MATSSGVSVAHTSPAASPPRLIDRAAVMAELAAAVSEPGAVALVTGEPGVGKTRLLNETFSGDGAGPAGPDHTVLWIDCPPLSEPYTLGPVVEALLAAASDRIAGLVLSELAGGLRPLFPEWGSHLPPALDPAGDAGTARHRIFRALAELLSALDVDLLVVDDLQWSDDVTREFLVFLTDRRDRVQRLVLAYRGNEGGDWLPRFTTRLRPAGPVVRLLLEPLDVEGTAALASSMLADQPVSGTFAEHLHRHTGGLPLAIEESVHLMVRRKDLVWRDGAWSRLPVAEIVVPPTVREAVLEQAARLDDEADVVLRAAAVAGEALPEAGLQYVCGLSTQEFSDGLAQCLDHGLLRLTSTSRVAFRHVLAARAVYEATPERERRQLHERAGLLLEEEPAPPLARLAAHFQRSGDTPRWERYADQAVEVALETGDDATACSLLFGLMAAPGVSAQRLCTLVDRVPFGSIPASAQLQELSTILRRMLDRGGHEPAVEAELRFQLSRILNEVDEFDAARAEVERALPNLQRDPSSVAISMILLGWPRGRSPRSVNLGWLDRARELAVQLPPVERLRITTTRAPALLLLGDDRGWAETEAIPVEAGDSGRERRIVTMAHANIGDAALRWGRYGDAERWLDSALRLASDYDQTRLVELAACTRVHLDWCTGKWQGLHDRASELIANEDIRPVGRLEPLMVRALLHLAAGETTVAMAELERVITGARDLGGWESVSEPAAAIARVHLNNGRVQDALDVTEDPVWRALRTGWPWCASVVPVRVEALVAAGQVEDAQQLTASFAAEAGTSAHPAHPAQAAVLECRALLTADAGEAAGLLTDAAALWAALPNPYRSLLVRERRGLAQHAAGDEHEALDGLALVLEEYVVLSALGDAERVAQVLRKHGRTTPRIGRGGRKGYGTDLSPRELEVVALAAQGHTNREIAELLHRSHHTVGTQLRSAMRKFEVGSRAALAVKVTASGLLDHEE